MASTTLAPQTYTWTFPGAPVRVTVQLGVIRQLQDQFLAGTGMAGILLGRAGRGQETEITTVAVVASEGPDAIATALKSLRCPDDVVPIGFYRAGAEGLRLSDEDYEAARTYFVNPSNVFLVIQLADGRPDNATFFFWDNGQIHRDFAILEFPFDAALLAKQEGMRARAKQPGPERVPVAPAVTHVPARSVSPQPQLQPQVQLKATPTPAPVTEHRRWRAVWLVLVCVSIGALLAAGARYLKLDPWAPKAAAPASSAAAGPSLGLKFHRQGTDLAVTWDREAVAKYGATAGLLTVRDGANEKAIGLNADLLRSANVLLSTESDQVQIQLTLLQSNQSTVSESGIALLPARGSTDLTVRSVPTAPRPVAAEQVAHAPRPLPEKSFTPPSGPSAPGPPRIEEPPVNPALSTSTVSHSPVTLPVVSNPAPRPVEPPPSPAPSTAPAAAVPTQPAASEAPPAATPVQAEAGTTVKPAEFLSGDKPAFPAAARNARVQGVVEVEAAVGTDGKVKHVKVITGHPLLRDAALSAVRGWTFKPATINGKPVEAPVRAVVNFKGVW